MVVLFPHQQEAVNRMKDIEKKGNGGILAHEPGCGKTITMSWYMKENKGMLPNLVVCPVAMMHVWEREIKRVNEDSSPKILIYHNNRSKSDFSSYDYIITSYTIISKDELTDFLFHRIVLDEAHYIRNAIAKRNPCKMGLSVLLLKGNYKWCLSGTPFNNRITDLASLAKFIGDEPYCHSDWWCGLDNNLVKEWMEYYVLKKTKDDLIEKPIYHDVEVVYTKIERHFIDKLTLEAQDAFENWEIAEGKDKIGNQGHILASILRLRMATDSIFCKKTVDTEMIVQVCSKVNTILDIINDRINVDPSKSIVVFTQFVSFIAILEQVLKEKTSYKIHKYTGDMSVSDRDRTIKNFTTDNTPRVLLISLMSGGVGLTLLPCSSVIISEPWYNPFVEKQAEERIHRIGQKNKVNIYRLHTKDSIEEWINGIKTVKLKQAQDIGIKSSHKITQTFTMQDVGNLFTKYVRPPNI